jgi:hypothetical protein
MTSAELVTATIAGVLVSIIVGVPLALFIRTWRRSGRQNAVLRLRKPSPVEARKQRGAVCLIAGIAGLVLVNVPLAVLSDTSYRILAAWIGVLGKLLSLALIVGGIWTLTRKVVGEETPTPPEQ